MTSSLPNAIRTALPRPGATRLQNFVATLLMHGNTPDSLNLEVLAEHNRWTTADDLLVEFRIQQNGSRKLPEECAAAAIEYIPTVQEVEE